MQLKTQFSAMMAAGLIAIGVTPTYADSGNQGIIPINAQFEGLTYSDWVVKAFQWISAIPGPSPLFPGMEDQVTQYQSGHLWFLIEFITSPEISLHYTVPAGKALYVPLFMQESDNLVCPPPPTHLNATELLASVDAILAGLSNLAVEIDGRPVSDVTQYRTTVPDFAYTLPAYNFYNSGGCDYGAGTYTPAVADGYALILAPLSVGEHVVHETLDVSDTLEQAFGWTQSHADITFHITVVPAQP
jgi:hypothetical protein